MSTPALPAREAERLLAFAHALADAAAEPVLEHFRAPLAIEDKDEGPGFDPVTAADRAAEEIIRHCIEAEYPDHGIIGEELPAREGVGPWRWVLDPIDGTRGYISGLPVWGTLIALCHGETPVIGLMSQPFVGERFEGSPLGAAHRDREGRRTPLHARACRRLDDAGLFATTPEMFTEPGEWEAFERLSAEARLTRFGGDCYAYALLAAGHIDLVVESSLAVYDVAALVPIVEQAGGRISDWRGEPASGARQVVAAATPELHETALGVLAPAAQ